MSQIDLPRRHHLDAIASERWTASDQSRWTPQLRYARAASLESADVVSAMADALVDTLRRVGLRFTQFADASAQTIRLRLLKLGAQVRTN